MYTFAVNVQDLILLAWLASDEIRFHAIMQVERDRQCGKHRKNGSAVIEDMLEQELHRIQQDHQMCSIISQLLRHQFAHLQIDNVRWALCGQNGVYYRKDALPRDVDETKNAFASRSETQVLCDALTDRRNLPLREWLRTQLRTWRPGQRQEHDDDKGELLQRLFVHAIEAAVLAAPGDFLIVELLRVSLVAIDWHEAMKQVLVGEEQPFHQ